MDSLGFATIFDLVLLAVLVFTVLRYRKRGFVAGLLDLVGNFVSLLLAWLMSQRYSASLFDTLFKTGLIRSTAQTIQEKGSYTLSAFLETIGKILPSSLTGGIAGTLEKLLVSGAPDLATQIVETVIAPLIVPILSVLVFFVVYAVCRVLIKFLVAALANLNQVPLLGGVNRTLGIFVGIAAGGINVLLVLCLVWGIVAITSDSLPVFNSAALSGSVLYSAFALYNPFV